MIDRAVPPQLDDVTLVAVSSVAIGPTLDAVRSSMRQARFAEALFLSDRSAPKDLEPEITWRMIEPLRSRSDYSRFMLRELGDHISTSHALCIQWDGFVLDGSRWNPVFVDFDYIGAVWPHFGDGHNVGNGGFSLRSKRLLDATKDLPFTGEVAEDVVIGRVCRASLERIGLRFAPEAVAREFAYERTAPTGREFGFHGAFNLVRYLSAAESTRLFGALEDQMLARNERWQLLWWAIRHARFGLARHILGKIV